MGISRGSKAGAVPAGRSPSQAAQGVELPETRARTRDGVLSGGWDESDPRWSMLELVQRGRMILDVAIADLDVAERLHGPYHPTTCHFRTALHEARWSWQRLGLDLGADLLNSALAQPAVTCLSLGGGDEACQGRGPGHGSSVVLVPIDGQTYRVQSVIGTELAPIQWRLTRLHPPLPDGPYYACRLSDGSTQCDCADWTYRLDQADPGSAVPWPGCKHIVALRSLAWI